MHQPGQVIKTKDGYEVKFVRHFRHDIQTVWETITDPEKLAIWFTRIDMDFVPGGEMTIYFDDKDQTTSKGRIVRIEEPVFFQFTWEDELATWELSAEGPSACKLVFTYSKLPDEYAISVPAGWHIMLDQLEEVLNGRKEPYPFGAGETPESKSMKDYYQDLLARQFPELAEKKEQAGNQ